MHKIRPYLVRIVQEHVLPPNSNMANIIFDTTALILECRLDELYDLIIYLQNNL